MWTTAGAIFSTTSAMKLNLYRGLVSWWRPVLAEEPGALVQPRHLGRGAHSPQGWLMLSFLTSHRQPGQEAQRGQNTCPGPHSTDVTLTLDLG